MKNILYLSLLLCTAALNGAAPEGFNPKIETAPKVSAATVYLDRAQLTRETTVSLQPGKTQIVFTHIPDNIDLKSFRAEISDTSVEISGISYERVITKLIRNDKLNELETAQARLANDIRECSEARSIAVTRQKLIDKARLQLQQSIAGQTAAGTVTDTAAWNTLLSALDRDEQVLRDEISRIENTLRPLQKSSGQIQAELSKYTEPTRASRINASVSLESPKAVSGVTVKLSYVTPCASWTPQYDARILSFNSGLNSKADSARIQFTYGGQIRQNSGEEWSGITVKLSTAQPQVSATPPAFQPLRLTAAIPDEGDAERQIAQTAFAVSMQNSVKLADAFVNSEEEEGLSEVSHDGPAVTFMLNGRHNLPTGDQPSRLTICENTFDGIVLYECMPAVRNYVYLKAKFLNHTPYPLLAGNVSIFRNSGFIGNSKIAFSAQNAEVPLFGGIADGVSVVREKAAEYQRTNGLISTSNENITSWSISLLNTTERPMTVRLREAIPVSEVSEVKVKLYDTKPEREISATTQGYNYNPKTGLIYWDVTLEPQQKTTLSLTYSVTR